MEATRMDLARLGIDVDTKGARQAPADLDRVTAAATRADAAAEGLEMAARSAGGALQLAAQQTRSATSAVSGAASGYDAVAASAGRAATASLAAAEASERLTTGFSGATSAGLRNASFQLSQVAQQASVTGDVIGALSIQLPDLLLSFGAMGALIGAAAVGLVPLVRSMVEADAAAGNLTVTLTAIQPALDAMGSAAEAVGETFGTTFRLAAENLDRIVITAGVAAAFFGGRFVAGVVAARIATISFSASLIALRGALIRTGIGALIVGAGELAFQFSRLVQATGGFGEAMGLLGQTAQDVWAGIKTSASAIGPALSAVWNRVREAFLQAVADMAYSWSSFLSALSAGAAGLDALTIFGQRPFEGISDGLRQASFAADDFASSFQQASNDAAGAAADAEDAARALASKGFDQAKEAASKLAVQVDEVTKTFTGSGDGSGDGGGGLAGAAEKAGEKIEDFGSTLRGAIQTAEQFGTQQAQSLITGINGIAGAWADWMTGGVEGFQGFVNDILSSARRFIADLIAQLTAQQILIPVALSVTGATGAVAATGAVQAAGGVGNVLGGASALAGGLGTFGGAVWTGLQGTFASGLGSVLPTVGASLSGIASGGSAAAGLGTALGAALPVIGAIGAIAAIPSLLREETETIDTGIRFQVNQLYSDLFEFEKTRTATRFGRGRYGTDFDPLRPELADPITAAIDQGRTTVQALGATVGLPQELPFEFGRDIKFGDMSEAEREAAIQQAIQDTVIAMADSYFDGVESEFIRAGENSLDALTRMSNAITIANTVFEQTGQVMFEVTREGADMASALIDAFGGAQNFSQAVGGYIEAFYSEQEQLDLLTMNLTRALSDLGLAMPDTRDEFRAMVEAFDLTTESGREGYATLVQLAGGFDEMFSAAEETTGAVAGVAEELEALTASAGAVAQFRRAFLSDDERIARQTADLAAEMERLGVAMPGTREEFTTLVDGIDRSAVAGNNLWVQLINLSAQFDEVFTSAEDAAAAVLAQAAANEEAARAAQEAARAAALAAAEARLDAANDAVSFAERALRESFDAQRERINDRASGRISEVQAATTAAVEALQGRIGGFQDQASDYRNLRSALTDALADRRVNEALNPGLQLREASAFLQRQAQRSSIGSIDAIREAARVVSNPDAEIFSSFFEFQREFDKNTVALDRIREIAGEDLSEAQRQIVALEATAAAVEAQGLEQVAAIEAARDAELANSLALQEAVLGVEEAVLSVAVALERYAGAIAERDAATAALDALPSFAGGGYTGNGPRSGGLDGEGGFLAMLHPREVVSDMTRGGGGGGGSSAEFAAIRRELAEIRRLAAKRTADTEKSRKKLDKFDRDGLPPERV